ISFLGVLLEVLGAAVAIMSGPVGWGLLAAAVLGVAAASQFGIIGGSIGKFMKSGWGSALVGAATLGTAAYAMYGQSVLEAGQVGAQATVQTGADAAGMGSGRAFMNAPVATPSLMGDAAGSSDTVAAMGSNDASMAANGIPLDSIKAVNMNSAQAAENLATPNLSATGAA